MQITKENDLKHRLLILLCLLSINCFQAHAGGSEKAVLTEMETSRIGSLKWDSTDLPVEYEGESTVALVQGHFLREGWTLWLDENIISTDLTGAFLFKVRLNDKKRTLTFTAKSEKNETETVKVSFRTADARPYRPLSSGLRLSPSLGYTYVAYTETQLQTFQQTSVTVKAAAVYSFENSPWSIGANVFLTAAALEQSRTDVIPNFLGANLRIGYSLPFIPRPLTFTLMAGIYYNVMAVTPVYFGYGRFLAPQLYPMMTLSLSRNLYLFGSAKFVPMGNSLAIDLTQREISYSAGIQQVNAQGRGFSLGVDIADLAFTLPSGLNMQLYAWTVNFGYLF